MDDFSNNISYWLATVKMLLKTKQNKRNKQTKTVEDSGRSSSIHLVRTAEYKSAQKACVGEDVKLEP